MMRALVLAAALAAAPAAHAQPWTARADDGSGLGWLRELAGRCWQGEYGGGMVDRQCYALQYGRFLRGTIEITARAGAAGPAPHRGDSMFAWNERRGAVAFLYWSSQGAFGLSEGRREGEDIAFYDPPKLDPDAPATRTLWRRPRNGAFEVRIQTRSAQGWTDTLSVTYRRQAPAPGSPATPPGRP
jgi:hypothetical protein